MNRREALKAAGASVLAGTALTATGAADERNGRGPKVVAIEVEGSDEGKTDEYTVDYTGDGRVEISGYTVAPNPCHELEVADITSMGHGDVVNLELVQDSSQLCVQVTAELHYTVELEYESEAAVNDVFVQIPDGAGT